MKEKEKNRDNKITENKNKYVSGNDTKKYKLLIIIIIGIIIALIIGKMILTKNEIIKENIKEEKEKIEIVEKEYDVKDTDSLSFENVRIKTKNNISYINMDIKNNQNQKLEAREIVILTYNNQNRLEFVYDLPEIDKDGNYKLTLMSTEDLSDIEKIEIKK